MLGIRGTPPDVKLQIIDDELATVNSVIDQYEAVCAGLDTALISGEIDFFVHEQHRTDYDQAYQMYFNDRKRLLTQRDRASSRLAKAVLKQKT